jgi:hypothetical protein
LEGHSVEGLEERRKPKDHQLVTQFEPDSWLPRLFDLQNNTKSAQETFGMVVVAGWVPSELFQRCYNTKFLPAVQQCFQESDWKSSQEDVMPKVYLYPSQALHVTIATFHAFVRPPEECHVPHEVLTREWSQILEAASSRPEWPTQPLELVLSGAQIGQRAGILLWKDLSGGVDQMRVAIHAETQARHDHLIQQQIHPETLAIPGIIHTTFLRFHRIPDTEGALVQERFQQHVLLRNAPEELSTAFFPNPIPVTQVKLACERRPYMHIPNDERHVLWQCSLGT